MDSHEYAARIRAEAEYLLSKPAFKMPNYKGADKEYYWYMFEKDEFIEAVRALGTGEKVMGPEYVEFHPEGAPLYVRIERSYVCKLVKPAEYDCEPFLKEEDHKIIDAASQIPVDSPPF